MCVCVCVCVYIYISLVCGVDESIDEGQVVHEEGAIVAPLRDALPSRGRGRGRERDRDRDRDR